MERLFILTLFTPLLPGVPIHRTNAHGFKVGQKVKVINAYDYYGNMFKCWYSKYDVIEVKNDRIVIGIGNTVTAAVNAANLAAA